MTTSEYSEKAYNFVNGLVASESFFKVGPKKILLMEGLMGMSSESGEALDILKKNCFQWHPLDKDELILEIGDVLWYMNLACKALDISLDEIMERNIEKLQKRYGERFSADKSINRTEVVGIPSNVYSLTEIARALGICSTTVRRWIKSGELKATIKNRKWGYTISKASLLEFVNSNPSLRTKYKSIVDALDD